MMLSSVKQKLILCRRSMNCDCAFGTILCAFFFEKIPTVHPHVQIRDRGPQEPRMYH